MNHWEIPQPGPQPPPGPAREAWLDVQMLSRHRAGIDSLLDSIDPGLRQNTPVTIDSEVVALKVLQYLDGLAPETTRTAKIPAILVHLNTGFRAYCRHHDYKMLRLPLVRELGIDEGLLDGDALRDRRIHREMIGKWCKRALSILASPKDMEPDEIAGLVLTSATLFGGLARPTDWKALLEALSSLPQVTGPYLAYQLRPGVHARRWIADPVTELLIRRLVAGKQLPLPSSWRPSKGFRAELAPYVPAKEAKEDPASARADAYLARACRGLLLFKFPPDIASIALGDLENTCLPDHAFRRLIARTLPIPADFPTIAATPRDHTPAKREAPPSFVSASLHEFKKAIWWNPEDLRKKGILFDDDKAEVRRDKYIKHVRAKADETKRKIDRHYLASGSDGSVCFTLVVLQFAKNLTIYGGTGKLNLAPATIDSYVGDVLDTLGALWLSDLRTLPTEERQRAYGEAISKSTSGNRTGVVVALRVFEATLLRDFDIEDTVDWSALPAGVDVSIRVDANMVDPTTYAVLWETLKTVRCTYEKLRPLWVALTLLLYRFGLRRGEAHELKVADIHFGAGREVRLLIPESRLTTNKSRQALRAIGPVILPEQEWRALKALYDARLREATYRKSLDDVYLFARPDHGSRLLDANTLFGPVTDILRWITGDAGLRIHHFRHSFASRLFASGRSSIAELDELSNHPMLWQECLKRDGAWLRAYELGHISPIESNATYCHCADVVHYYFSCAAVAEFLLPEIADHLLELAPRSFERALNREAKSEDEGSRGFVELLLKKARSTWPLVENTTGELSPEQFLGTQSAPPQVAYIPPTSIGMPTKLVRFADLLDIMRGHLTGKIDVSAWEGIGIAAPQVREWIATIDSLVALGIVRAGRQRSDRMPDLLVTCGQQVIASLHDAPVTNPAVLLARCLAGFGNPITGNRVDVKTAEGLKAWLEFRNPTLRVEIQRQSRGHCRYRLIAGNPISHTITQIFLAVLAVPLLRKEMIDTHVSPYRTVPHTPHDEHAND